MQIGTNHSSTLLRSARLDRLLRLCAIVITFSLVAMPRTSVAQTESTTTASSESEKTSVPGARANSSKDEKPEIIYLIDESGKKSPLIFLKPGQTPEEAWKQRQSTQQDANEQQPAAGVTRVSLTGEVQGNRAVLEAKIVVQVLIDGESVPVELRMAEATLIDNPQHEGPGRVSPGKLNGAKGRTWWFQGRGEHRLTFKLSVPVQERSPGSRLQLSLPPAAFSELKLRVPHARVTATLQKQVDETAPIVMAAGRSEIHVAGLGSLLDLSWKPRIDPQASMPVLEADSTVFVDIDAGAVFAEARQQIRAIDGTGTFETLSVHLPKKSKLLSLHGAAVAGYQPDKQLPDTIHIQLKQATRGPIELNWNLELSTSSETSAVEVEGFDVEGAVRQSGMIGLRVEARRQLDDSRADLRFVRRVDVADAKKQFSRVPTAVYRFSKQPFHLTVAVRTVEPHTTVSPILILTFSADSIDFEGMFLFRVARGSVKNVEIRWPNWRGNGWTLQPHEENATISDRIEDGDDRIVYRLKENVGGTFEVRLKAKRSLTLNGEPIDFDLPLATATSHRQGSVVVDMQDNVEVDSFKPEGETVARLLGAPPPVVLQRINTTVRRQLIVYEVDSDPLRFTATVTAHSPSVQTSTIVRLNASDQLSPTVRQTINYTAAWGRLDSVSLLVPSSISEKVQFFSESIPLTRKTWPDGDQPGWKRVTLTLDRSRIGRFEVQATYDVDEELSAALDRGQILSIPVIQSGDSDFLTTRFQADRPEGIAALISDQEWQLQTDGMGLPIWTAKDAKQFVPVSVSRTNDKLQKSVSIARAYVETFIEQDGTAHSVGHYLITDSPQKIEFTLPSGSDLDRAQVKWDGEPLVADQISTIDATPGHYTLSVPTSSTDSAHVLMIGFHSLNGRSLSWSNAIDVAAPKFAGKSWVGQSIWEIVLTDSQLLFADPKGFTSQNRWRREGLGGTLWVRQPQQSPTDLQQWLPGIDRSGLNYPEQSGNRYQFACFGSHSRMQFQSMSWPMIVGIGSGLSLVLGLMFQYVPGARNVLSLLLIAFVTAIVGVWYTSPVLLLLQASGLGLVLAIVSSLIQRFIRRRRSGMVTVHSASDYIPSVGSSVDHEVVSASGAQKTGSMQGTPGSDAGAVVSSSSTVTGASR